MPKSHPYPLPKVYTSENPTQDEIYRSMTTAMSDGIPGPGYTGWVPKDVYDRIEKFRQAQAQAQTK